VTGYNNLVFKKEDIEHMAEKRSKICSECGELNKAGFYLHCDLCGCYIPAKLRVPEEFCKLGKWGKEDGTGPTI
jgi:hypothetical protein